MFYSWTECLLQVKGGEDLRVDQRVEQLFEVMNAVMGTSASCRRAGLTNKTYKVGGGVSLCLDVFFQGFFTQAGTFRVGQPSRRGPFCFLFRRTRVFQVYMFSEYIYSS